MNADARIEMETWEGPLSKRERCLDATAVALREALSRLDGRRVDSVWIEVANVGTLCVGGGPSEFVVVSFHADGSSSHVVSGDDDGNTVELQVGGQTGVYPSAMVLPAAAAFDIAERFWSLGSDQSKVLSSRRIESMGGSETRLRRAFLLTKAASNDDPLSTGLAAHPSCIVLPCQGLIVTSFQDFVITSLIAVTTKLTC